jgi:hypothetical protein
MVLCSTQCWKPDGAVFSIVAVIPVDKVSVTANADKLKVVNEAATILRHACKDCGVHLYGRIEKDRKSNTLLQIFTKHYQKHQTNIYVLQMPSKVLISSTSNLAKKRAGQHQSSPPSSLQSPREVSPPTKSMKSRRS